MGSLDTRAPRVLQNSQQVQERSPPSSSRIKVQEPSIPVEATAGGQFFRRLFSLVFCIHLCLIAILVIFLTVRGLQSASQTHHFHPAKWYPPLLTSTASSGIVAFSWQGFTGCYPSKAFKIAFWLSPLLSLTVGVFFVVIGSAGGLAAGVIFIVSSFILSLYVCWVNPRFNYAIQLLSVSTAFPPTKTIVYVIQSILTGILFASFLVSGIGGAIAARFDLEAFFTAVILLSLAWTLQVIKNIVQVTISRIKYLNFACGVDMDARVAFRDTIKYLIGTISIGSALAPFLGFIQGSARAMKLIAGEPDEFLFSCANCYSGVASTMISHGNRWGFVHVGVYNKGFVQSSVDTWEAFKRVGLQALIDSDLTGSFCFLCGISGGAICGIISGLWALVIHKSYATELAIYAFLIGYFLCRIGMAWPQACVAAYYVAYADNPQDTRFDSTIPDRIRDLRRLQA